MWTRGIVKSCMSSVRKNYPVKRNIPVTNICCDCGSGGPCIGRHKVFLSSTVFYFFLKITELVERDWLWMPHTVGPWLTISFLLLSRSSFPRPAYLNVPSSSCVLPRDRKLLFFACTVFSEVGFHSDWDLQVLSELKWLVRKIWIFSRHVLLSYYNVIEEI